MDTVKSSNASETTLQGALSKLDIDSSLLQKLTQPETIVAIQAVVSILIEPVLVKVKNDIIAEVSNSKSDHQDLIEKCDSLEQKVNQLEQYSRRNSVRMFGFQETENENATELVVNYIQDSLGMRNIDASDIDRCHRIGRLTTKPRAIIVKFVRHTSKRDVMVANKQLVKRCRQNKEALPRIVIREDLTAVNISLIKQAMDLTRMKKLQSVWSFEGRIFIKDNKGVKHQVSNSCDMEKFCSDLEPRPPGRPKDKAKQTGSGMSTRSKTSIT